MKTSDTQEMQRWKAYVRHGCVVERFDRTRQKNAMVSATFAIDSCDVEASVHYRCELLCGMKKGGKRQHMSDGCTIVGCTIVGH